MTTRRGKEEGSSRHVSGEVREERHVVRYANVHGSEGLQAVVVQKESERLHAVVRRPETSALLFLS